jgi:hypothetical protein
MVSSVLCGQLTSRTCRYKIFPVTGSALMVAAMAAAHFRLTPDIALWELDLYMALFGIGLGGCMQTLVLAVQNAVPARDMGVATASATFFRQTGGTLGIAIFLSILFTSLPGKITTAFAGNAGQAFRSALTDPAVLANPANQQIVHSAQDGKLSAAASGVLSNSAFLQQIDPRLARPFLVGFTNSITLTILVVVAVLALAFVTVLFIKEVPLRAVSGAQARLAEEAGAAPVSPAAAPAGATAPAPPKPGPATSSANERETAGGSAQRANGAA